MSKVTGEMILKAISEQGEMQKERFIQLEKRVELRITTIERTLEDRLGAQRDRIKELWEDVKSLNDNVGFIKALCSFAKIFKTGKV